MIDSENLSANAYELLIKGVVDYAIYLLDPKGHVVSWNPGAERIKGYTADEIVGAHFSRFYTDEDRAAGVPENALKIAAESGRFTTEAWRRRKDGSRFWALVAIDAIRRGGRLIGFAKITRDMTEQHAAQLAALESERRFRLLVQGVTDYAIYMLSPEGRITNEACTARSPEHLDLRGIACDGAAATPLHGQAHGRC
jgi:PAS domain S-box-containing protein